jgi:MFS family permease
MTSKDTSQNRRINRKMDLALLPFLSLLYLFNGLDRGNVGNAQTQGSFEAPLCNSHPPDERGTGFTHDIGVAPDDFNLAVSLFFLTFVLFQPFSAAMGRYFGPKHWIPVMMVCFPSNGLTLMANERKY